MKQLICNKRGFTLVEILTAVIIVAILVVMAMPLYEKTIERSRLAEARTVLAKLQDAKIQTMDNMGCNDYTSANVANGICPNIAHLNVAFANEAANEGGTTFQTKDFVYTLVSTTYPNGVCAKRRTGDYKDTLFVYRGSVVDGQAAVFACNGEHCSVYGFESETFSCSF